MSTPSAVGAAANARRCGSRRSWRAAVTRPWSRRAPASRWPSVPSQPVSKSSIALPCRRSMSAPRGGCAESFTRRESTSSMRTRRTQLPLRRWRPCDLECRSIVARRVDFRFREKRYTMEVRPRRGDRRGVAAPWLACSKRRDLAGPDSRRAGWRRHAQKISPAPRDARRVGVGAGAPLVVQVAQLVGHKDPVNFVRAMARVTARAGGHGADGRRRSAARRRRARDTIARAGRRRASRGISHRRG